MSGWVLGLSTRQAEVLVSIYWRLKNYGVVHVRDLVGDIGVAFGTLFDHLKKLQEQGYVNLPRLARNLGFNDRIGLTSKGERKAKVILSYIRSSTNEPLDTILRRIREVSAHRRPSLGDAAWGYGYGGKRAAFSHVVNELFRRNPTEPVASTIAMYSDLDPQLYLLRSRGEREEFVRLSRGHLNIEIRIGRVASIAVPVGLRRSIKRDHLRDIIEKSWSWPGIVSTSSVARYFAEASSMGLISQQDYVVKTMSPTVTSMLEWLSAKTLSVFTNTIKTMPKAAIILYREAFKFPTVEDLYNPKMNDRLDWLSEIYSKTDRDTYKSIVRDALIILRDKTSVLQQVEGTDIIIPAALYRKLDEAHELRETVLSLVKRAREGNVSANILLTIQAKPGISIHELMSEIRKRTGYHVSEREIRSVVNHLVQLGLVYVAQPPGSQHEYLYTFTQIPFLTKGEESKEANIILRNIKPWLLSSINESFSIEERRSLTDLIEKLAHRGAVDLSAVEKDYGKKFFIKLLMWLNELTPFIKVDVDNEVVKLNNKYKIAYIVIDVLHYSLLTGNEALSMYAPLLADIVRKSDIERRIYEEARELKEELGQKIIKRYAM